MDCPFKFRGPSTLKMDLDLLRLPKIKFLLTNQLHFFKIFTIEETLLSTLLSKDRPLLTFECQIDVKK